MFGNNGLSLQQAPPISVVFRFFLAGSVFGIIDGVLILCLGKDITIPYAPEGLMVTHIFTLGTMLSFMLGALFQMLPVLGGVSLKDPEQLAVRTQYPLLAGTVFLVCAFGSGERSLYILAGILIVAGIVPASVRMASGLLKLRSHTASSRGMQWAVFSLIAVFLSGLFLLICRSGLFCTAWYTELRGAHYAFGLYGWISALIASVSFQVIEMFYVTAPYPRFISRYFPGAMLLLAGTGAVFSVWVPLSEDIFDLLTAIFIAIYAAFTLLRLSQRLRPVSDATVWFWRTGAASMLLFSGTVAAAVFFDTGTAINTLSFVFFAIFATSIVFGMSYKIIPFLTWFHLNAQGYLKAPMMHEVIHPKYAMMHLRIHTVNGLAAVYSVFQAEAWPFAGAMTALSFLWLAIAIYRTWHLYLHIRNSSERFVMGS